MTLCCSKRNHIFCRADQRGAARLWPAGLLICGGVFSLSWLPGGAYGSLLRKEEAVSQYLLQNGITKKTKMVPLQQGY